MKTIIKIKTWFCTQCDYRQDFEPTLELMRLNHYRNDTLCPSCKKTELTKEIDVNKKITITVMGEEDIETEIEKIKERKLAGKELKNDPDVSTLEKENSHRAKRIQDITLAVSKAKELEDNL